MGSIRVSEQDRGSFADHPAASGTRRPAPASRYVRVAYSHISSHRILEQIQPKCDKTPNQTSVCYIFFGAETRELWLN